MAKFKVGDRVRISKLTPVCRAEYRELLGVETVITFGPITEHGITGYRTAASDKFRNRGLIGVEEIYLAPLTDPKADAFIERIKKLGKEPINDAPKVTVTK